MKQYRSKSKAKQETLKTSQLQCTIKATQSKLLKKRKNKSEKKCRKKVFRSIRKKRRCRKKSVSLRTLLKSEKLKSYLNSLKSQSSPPKEKVQINLNTAKETKHENKTALLSQLSYNGDGLNLGKTYAIGNNYTENFAYSPQPVQYDYRNYYANYDYSCGNEYKFYEPSTYFQSYPQQYSAYYNVNGSSLLVNPNDYKFVPVKLDPAKLQNQNFVVCRKVPCGKYQQRNAPGYFKDVFDDVETDDVSAYLNENKDVSHNLNSINNLIDEQLHLQILKRDETVNENKLDASTGDSLISDLIIEQPSYKCETRDKSLIYEPVF